MGNKKGKAKKRCESPNVSSTEQSEDDGSGTKDANDNDDDGGDHDNGDHDNIGNSLHFPLPFSALKVNYGMPISSAARHKSRLARLKSIYNRKNTPRVEGK